MNAAINPLNALPNSAFLTRLFDPEYATDLACFDGDTPHRHGDIRRDIAVLSEYLGSQNHHRIAVHCASARLFLIAIAAIWHHGATTILPASNREGYLAEIGDRFDLLLDNDQINEIIARTNAVTLANSVPDTLPAAKNCRAIFYTSGSTGTPKPIEKSLAQLESEMALQIPLWQAKLRSDARILGLVSHQHIYGMLFRVIWPAMTGRVFQSRQARFWEDIIADAKDGDVIVASPAHLQRLHPDLAEMARPGLIFCSGGPLDLASAGQTKTVFDRLPTEIFGSTETGGIAWRRQSGPDTPWRALPNVLVDLDDNGCLKVRAAHIGSKWYQTEDRAVFDPANPDGDFRLRGRVDRVVKIEGKRVSLSAVERHLRQSDLVEDAVVLVPSANGQPDARLAAIVILNADAQVELEKLGNFRMGRVLRRHLSKFEESAALPQRWRFVAAFPVDSQGKKPHHLLSNLFDNPAPRTALHADSCLNSIATNEHPDIPTDPVWTSLDRNGDTALIGLSVPENLLFFQGHFANHPVLPGVVQLHWAQNSAHEAFGLSQIPHEVTQLKFRRTIGPGDTITLRLDFNRDKRQVKFSYADADSDRASGILKFRETS